MTLAKAHVQIARRANRTPQQPRHEAQLRSWAFGNIIALMEGI
jgi:hypothetical protein